MPDLFSVHSGSRYEECFIIYFRATDYKFIERRFWHQMINYDLPWNPMKIEQRIGRIHRRQEKEVVIYNLCATGSAEDYILEVLDKKINMFELVIGEIDIILGRIRGEKEFPEMAYDIWVQSDSDAERKKVRSTGYPLYPNCSQECFVCKE